MKADDQNMDEQFRKAAGESQFPYRAEFWNEVESQLSDDLMDDAFRSAAGNLAVTPAFSFDDDMADAHLDEAFSSAASTYSAEYDEKYWKEYLQSEAILEQDVAFNAAANAVTADYHSAFWSDADIALQNEGLHYEYQTAYWNEARQLLDRADRRVFFMRWSAVAAVLLLLSIGGIYQAERFVASHHELAATEHSAISNQQFFGATFESDSDQIDASNERLTSMDQETVNSNIADQNYAGVNANVQNQSASIGMNGDSDNHQNASDPDLTNRDLVVDQDVQPLHVEDIHTGNNLNSDAVDGINGADQTNLSMQSSNMINQVNADPLSEEMQADFGFSLARNQSETSIHDVRLMAPTVEIKKLETKGTHQISFIANAGVGNRYNKVDFIPSLRTSIGFEYMHKGYGKHRNLEFGGTVTLNHARQNDFGTERRVTVFNNDGGVDKFWYKLQLKDMIYTNISGLASYSFSRKQNLRLSLGIDYLMFVQSNMSYQTEADKGITTVNNNWGVKEGLNKFDVRMGLGYEYQFSQRFAGQLNGNFGFFDRTDDHFIEKSFFDQEMSVTIGFKYTFLRIP